MKEINKERIRATAKKVAKEIEKGAKNMVAVVSGFATAVAPVAVPVVAVGAGVALGYVLTGCKNSTNPEPVPETIPEANPCVCNPKNHLGIGETCNCGGDDCDCELKEYGNVNGIPVYREAAASDTDASTGANNARAGYAAMTNVLAKSRVTTAKVTKIILTVNTWECGADGGKFILKIPYNTSVMDMTDAFETWGSQELAMFQMFDNSKETVRLSMGRDRSQRVFA